jgi:hypothetical protein
MKPVAQIIGKAYKVLGSSIKIVITHRGDIAERNAITENERFAMPIVRERIPTGSHYE